jgi:N utilization substance protein A
VPDDQLALAIGKEGLNARLAARLTGWKIDIQSDTEFAQAESEAAFGGGDDEAFTGRCVAILSTGKRCPNAALPGSRFCGVPGHQELAAKEARGEDISAKIVQPVEPEAGGEEETETSEVSEELVAEADGPPVSPEAELAPPDQVPAGIPIEQEEAQPEVVAAAAPEEDERAAE